MKKIGIICEYNPFHNGHLYHISKIKEMFDDSLIILVMSGNFTQRGEASIIPKYSKCDIALLSGIDLVIELPFIFATQSADVFAKTSIEILDKLNVDYVVFGSETNDINKLTMLAKTQINNKKYDKLVKEYLDKGVNYPTALSKALYQLTDKKIDKPNDILGVSYIREILKLNSNITPICIKRSNDYNSIELNDNITSASSIRYALSNGDDVKNYVPEYVYGCLKNPIFTKNYFNLLKYKIMTENTLEEYQTVDEGIQNRIKNCIIKSKDLDDLILKVKTKRYTYNKLSRMFIHILCNLKKEEVKKYNKISYIRVLGFNIKGRNYLNEIKKDIDIPIITNFSRTNDPILDIEMRSTCVYASILNEKDKINLIESEYKDFPIIR